MTKSLFGVLFILISTIFLVGCGKKPEDPFAESPETVASRAAEYDREKRELAAVKYPECKEIWSKKRLTKCGEKRLEIALSTCGQREGRGDRLDPLSAGDSWLDRAGRASVQTVADRARRIEQGNSIIEEIAYLDGNGTNGITLAMCFIGQDLKLTSTGSTPAR